jgi:transcriptional regulator with XRE-family HTH domain
LPGSADERSGDIRDRLKQAMAEKGLDGAPALARACGLKESTARSYIYGARSPSLRACQDIASFLGVSPDWLAYGTGPHDASAETGAAALLSMKARLAIAEAELRSAKTMLADLRRDRDAWRAQAERLAGKLTP